MEEHIINIYEEIIDGILYIVKVYNDGYIARTIKEGYENAITNTEEKQLELESNVQYLVDLMEINMEG